MTSQSLDSPELIKRQLKTDILLLRKQLTPFVQSRFYTVWKLFKNIPFFKPPAIPDLSYEPADMQDLQLYRKKLEEAVYSVHRSSIFQLRMMFAKRTARAYPEYNREQHGLFSRAWNTLSREAIQVIITSRTACERGVAESPTGVKRTEGCYSALILHHSDKRMTLRCIESLLQNSTGDLREILVLNNGTSEPVQLSEINRATKQFKTEIRLVQSDANMSFSAGNNYLAKKARGTSLIFVNSDIEALPGWFSALNKASYVYKNTIFGAKLIYPEYPRKEVSSETLFPQLSIQHEGIGFVKRTSVSGDKVYLPENLRKGDHPFSPIADTKRSVAAVSAACMCIPRTIFEKLHGFDEGYYYGYEDVDICLSAWQNGLNVVYLPEFAAFHYEFGTQDQIKNREGKDVLRRRNELLYLEKWSSLLENTILLDKLNSGKVWADTKLSIGVMGEPDQYAIEQIRAYITNGGPGSFQWPATPECDLLLYRTNQTNTKTSDQTWIWSPEVQLSAVLDRIRDEISASHNNLLS